MSNWSCTASLQGFIRDCRSRGLTDITIRSYVQYIKQFQRFLEEKDCSLLDASKLDVRLDSNPVIEVRKRYQRYKTDGESQTHKIISIEDAALLIDSVSIRWDDKILFDAFQKPAHSLISSRIEMVLQELLDV
jgi:site-specific recombinase XerD